MMPRPASNSRIILTGTAAALAVGAAILGSSRPRSVSLDPVALARAIEHEEDHVTAVELAQWIRDRKAGLRVLDVRSDSEYAAYHIPSAEHIPLSALVSLRPRVGETLVLYSEGGAHAAQGWVLLRAQGHDKVFFLRGGVLDWLDDVMNPVLPASSAPDTASERIAALSRYFGGVPRRAGGVTPAANAGVGSTVARMKRRGC